MFIDSHAHIFDIVGNKDFSNIDAVIVPSYKYENFISCIDACKSSKCYPALGIHPQFAYEYNKECENFIIQHSGQLVAIGEIGLDDRFGNFDTQIYAFEQQLALAQSLKLPAIIHLVGKKSYDYIRANAHRIRNGVLHAFSGTMVDCKIALDNGLYISFAGNITYKRNEHLRKIASIIPSNRLLIETDSPSMLPNALSRGTENTISNIIYVAETIAKARNCSVEQIANITKDNAVALFLSK